MRYQEAFARTIKRYGLDVLSEGFLFYSLVSDLVGSSINDLLLLDIYYALNRDVLILNEIRYKHLYDAKTYVKSLILKTDRRYKVEQYIKSVEPLFIYLYPNEYQVYQGMNNVDNSVQVVKAPRKSGPSPVPIKTPKVINKGIVVQKVVKKQAKTKNQYQFNTININAKCREFTIKYGDNGHCRLVDEDGIVMNNSNNLVISQGSLNIDISNKKKKYILELPDKSYQSLNVIYVGSKFYVSDFSNDSLNIKKININAMNSYISVLSNNESLNVYFNRGSVGAFGRFKNINIKGNYGDVVVYNSVDKMCTYNILVDSGDIELQFPNGGLRPKINHLFKPVSSVNGNYIHNNHIVKLNVVTNSGKIKVK